MSISAILVEGARRAATYATLLFNLNATQPAAVAMPPVQPEAMAPLAVGGSIAATGLTLVAHHVDARVAATTASVQVVLLLRNDTAVEIPVQYVLPYPARLFRRDADGARGEDSPLRDDTDLPQTAAEQAETARAQPVRRYDVVVVAPGEQITFEVERDAVLDVRGPVHRLRLPLSVDSAAPFTPRFSADVFVEADRPIRRLASPTHPVLVDRIGERTALLSVEEGRVHRQAQFIVEFELETVKPLPIARTTGQANDQRTSSP